MIMRQFIGGVKKMASNLCCCGVAGVVLCLVFGQLEMWKMGKEMIVISMVLLLILLLAGFMSNSKIIKRACVALALLIILAINVAVVDMFAAAGLFGR
jgi:predicted MFS family arabinose efflux permease